MLQLRAASAASLAALFLLPALARADDKACVAVPDTPFFAPGAPEVQLGTLKHRQCFAILERLDGRLRIWVASDGSFQGEGLISDDAVLQVLVDDVDLRSSLDGEAWGRAISGTPVRVLGRAGDGVKVRTVEGRLQVEFVVAPDAVFPTGAWPEPDPDDRADGEWPVGERIVPPQGGVLGTPGDWRTPRAKVAPLSHAVEDLVLDPSRGLLRYTIEEAREHDALVVVVGPTIWLRAEAQELDWRNDPPEGGWDPAHGAAAPAHFVPSGRQVGKKDAELILEPKGLPAGKLPPGAFVAVEQEDGSWLRVKAAWPEGEVSGWIEKKRLLKEGKEEPAAPVLRQAAVVRIGSLARQWEDAEGHEEGAEPEVDLAAVRAQLAERAAALQVEYAHLLRRSPGIGGSVAARVVVAADGSITQAHLPQTEIRDVALQERLVSLLETLTFEEREVPRKRRRSDPDLNWSAQVWMQLDLRSSLK